jgi:aldehyde:ferredoxin oxidoreductase
MDCSYHNKILYVDLSEGTITVKEPGQVYLRRYMGGWNMIADTLLKEVPKGADPLGPENVLVFAPGLLTGGFGAAEVGGQLGRAV